MRERLFLASRTRSIWDDITTSTTHTITSACHLDLHQAVLSIFIGNQFTWNNWFTSFSAFRSCKRKNSADAEDIQDIIVKIYSSSVNSDKATMNFK